MGALDTLVRSIKAGKYGRPFYSRLDEALEGLKREKGTAEEFLRELEKQPGVKKAEIEDRGLRKALEARSQAPDAKKPITKERMQNILREQAPMPPVVEDVLAGKHAEYEQYKTPGGENYREILLKLPEDYLREPFMSQHFGDNPNILAHMRVQDFKSPEGKKVLLVDEIQSDWHQAGRKEGYRTGREKIEIQNLVKEYDSFSQLRKDLLKKAEDMPDGGVEFATLIDEANAITPKLMQLQTSMDELRLASTRGVPDAPFKKNWHELAMKRVLDYAAEKGYDTVAITPGAEQAKRYDLSKHINDLEWDSQTGTLRAWDHAGNRVISEGGVSEQDLPNYIGKEAAQRLLEKEHPTKQLFGQDLQVGGEGMKGFYDKILPDYLNTYGKQYGAGVGKISLKTPSAEPWNIEDAARFHGMTGPEYLDNPNRSLLEKQFLENRGNKASEFHSFDITPQMREAIKTKGQPLYSAMGAEGLAAGTGAATIGAEALTGNNEQAVQNPVHFTENPDAMRLEMMQRN